MRTSEVLNRAADLIEERGWAHAEGWAGGPFDTPLCIEGAIATAAGFGFGISLVNNCPAGRAVREYLLLGEYDETRRGLWAWNDAQRWDAQQCKVVTARTAAEVIEVLRATAIIEAAKEDEALAAEFLTWQGSEISA